MMSRQRSIGNSGNGRAVAGGAVLALAIGLSSCQQVQGLKESLLGGGEKVDTIAETSRAVETLLGAGQLDAALAKATELRQQNPNAAEGFYWTGRVHLTRIPMEIEADADPTQDEIASVDSFERALTINPRHALSAVGLGDLFSRRVRSSKSPPGSDDSESPYALTRAAYEKAVTIDPALPEAQRRLAEFHDRTGSTEQAETAYRAAIDAAATIPEIAPECYLAYGRFLAVGRRLDEALDQFELAAMFRQDDAEIQVEMAKVQWRIGDGHMRKNQYSLAQVALEKADRLFPDPTIDEAQKTSQALARLESIRGRR